jgi:hypothetical protein
MKIFRLKILDRGMVDRVVVDRGVVLAIQVE